jgi:hypothetical protein
MPLIAWLPLVAVLLVQPPGAEQDVAPVEFHVSVDVPPLPMLAGLAVSVTVGCAATVTVAAPLPVPPVPVQLKLYVVVEAMPLTTWLPLVALLLVQPPLAAHEVAFVEDQLSVELPPLAMVAGLALTVTVGAATTVTTVDPLPEPPVPEQVIA